MHATDEILMYEEGGRKVAGDIIYAGLLNDMTATERRPRQCTLSTGRLSAEPAVVMLLRLNVR